MHLVCCLVLLLGGLQLTCAQLRVGAWNLECFGPKKANLPGVSKSPPTLQKATILNYIAMVICNYDIILIQEVRDSSINVPVMMALMTAVNNQASQYLSIHSEPLGRTPNSASGMSYKERYLYIYNTATVTLIDANQYVPLRPRTFDRPPYLAQFQSKADQNFVFVLIPQHTSPKWAACREIDALVDVVDYAKTRYGPLSNILLLGDFNAACAYVSGEDWEDIRLRTQTTNFHWLIDDSMNTAVVHKHPKPPCAYDRIVANPTMKARVVGGSAKVIDFELQWALPSISGVQVSATEVTNHFIVEVTLQ